MSAGGRFSALSRRRSLPAPPPPPSGPLPVWVRRLLRPCFLRVLGRCGVVAPCRLWRRRCPALRPALGRVRYRVWVRRLLSWWLRRACFCAAFLSAVLVGASLASCGAAKNYLLSRCRCGLFIFAPLCARGCLCVALVPPFCRLSSAALR